MNANQTIDFRKKSYTTPHINVVSIKKADILCTSTGSLASPLCEEPEDFEYGGRL